MLLDEFMAVVSTSVLSGSNTPLFGIEFFQGVSLSL